MKPRDFILNLFDRDSRAITCALVLLLLAVLVPKVSLPRSTYDFIVVFDISQSMGVEDYELRGAPMSRLDYARAAARQALRELPCGSRVGWGVFAEYRTLLLLEPVEVCDNYNDLVASLDLIDGRMRWANASEIMKGVYWSMRTAKEVANRPNVIFLTDGQEAPPIDPAYPPQMFEDLKAGEVHGWLMGAGGATPRRIPRTDEEGRRIGYWQSYDVLQRFGAVTADNPGAQPREHLSGLREAHLKTLAKQVGFDYARLESEGSISSAMQHSRFAQRASTPTDISGWLAAAALALLALRFLPRLPVRPALGQLPHKS